ncbi:MAG: GxxExxY protein, partial [Bradymonadaceae bacterium]
MAFHQEVANDGLTYSIIGIAIDIHKELGPDHLEEVYSKALHRRLLKNNIKSE